MDDDGHVILNADCDPLNTFFRPGYSRTLIATFAICHTLALLAYFVLVAYRLGELCYTKYIDSDLEISEHRAKKILALFSRIFPIDSDLIQEEEYIKRQIRYKLYAISGAGKEWILVSDLISISLASGVDTVRFARCDYTPADTSRDRHVSNCQCCRFQLPSVARARILGPANHYGNGHVDHLFDCDRSSSIVCASTATKREW